MLHQKHSFYCCDYYTLTNKFRGLVPCFLSYSSTAGQNPTLASLVRTDTSPQILLTMKIE